MSRIIVVLAVMVASAGAASAHALMRNATPRVGATVDAPPTQVTIDYSEAVEPKFSTIVVQDALGARVDTGAVQTAPGDDKRLVVALKPLSPGAFKVTWHVTSKDTHKTEGSFSFTVRP